MPELIFENSAWWLMLIVVLSALATWLLYFRGRSFTKAQRRILAVLRFAIFVLIGILLLSPLLKSSERKEEKPILVWMEDHSRSMVLNADSTGVRDQLADQELLEGLEEKYSLEQLDFGKDVLMPSDSFSASGTNIYEALSSVQERYYNQNVGGVVLLSDGISNLGNNPAYAAQGLPYPVFTLGFGDTTSSADMLIDRVVSNNVSYLNNDFPVEIYLKARQLSGNNYSITITDTDGKRLFAQTKAIEDNDYFQRIDLFLKAEKVGLQRFTVNVSQVGGEENLDNNSRSFTVDVLNNRKKVNIIGSGPHPDMAALANALRSVEKYEVNSYIATDLPASLEKADLNILHDPTALLLQQFVSKQEPVWIFVGPATPVGELQQLTGISLSSSSFEEVQPHINGSFNLFSLSEAEIEFASELPPLWSPFGRTETPGQIHPLFTKQIGKINTTDPVWFYAQTPERRRAFTLGTGIWRWRIEAYRQQKTFERFDALVYKTVQYLTTAKQERRFMVDIADRFDESEPIRGEVRLYNSSLELINDPELKITFTNEKGQTFDFSFSKTQSTYQLNAGRLAPGVYNWTSGVELGSESFTQNGSFVVEQSRLEESDLVARHDLLRTLSRESGAQFFKSTAVGALKQALLQSTEAKSIQVLETNTVSLINKKWIFVIFLVLMAMEWGLRKYFGNY